MSDSSEDEDLSRFKEAVDSSFCEMINDSRNSIKNGSGTTKTILKSERYLEESSHYNDVKVPEEMQKRIGAKLSAIIQNKFEFVEVDNCIKKRKVKGGVKLFKTSVGFLSCKEAEDTYTEGHNAESKKLEKIRRKIEGDSEELEEEEKLKAVAVSGDYVMSKEETKTWKSRRKEKLFKYKTNGKSKMLTAID